MKQSDLERTERFHRVKPSIPGIVKKFLRGDHILYGGKAIDEQVISRLRTQSKDFDVFSKTPNKDARNLKRELNKSAGANVFSVEKAKFPKTTKVKDLRGETVADFTQTPRGIKVKSILGKKVQTIDSMVPKIKRALRIPENEYRYEKDTDNLNRILLMRKLRKNVG